MALTLNAGSKKQEFQLDNGGSVWLDPSDQNILQRLNEQMGVIGSLQDEFIALGKTCTRNGDGGIRLGDFIEKHKAIDQKLRQAVDAIFDSDVSDACTGKASMLDFVDGQFRVEVIINGLFAAYNENLKNGYADSRKRIDNAKKKRGDRGRVVQLT